MPKVTQCARGSGEVRTPGSPFPSSLQSWIPDHRRRPLRMDPDPSRPGLRVGPHLRPKEEGRGRPDRWRMPGRQGRGCSRSPSSRARGGAGAGLRADGGRRAGWACPAGARAPPRLTCGASRQRAAAAAAGAVASPGLSHSPLPRMGRDGGRSLP